jgi:hypothetical protein
MEQKKKTTQHRMFEIQGLTWNRKKKVAGLNHLMGLISDKKSEVEATTY